MSGFQSDKSKVSSQGRGSVIYSTIDLDSYADTIFCGSKCIVINFVGKEGDVAPYTNAYETIKAVSMVQSDTAYENPETGENTILILNKAICIGETMDHTLVNPNQLYAYGITFEDKTFSKAPIFIATEDHGYVLLFSSKETIPGVTTRTPTYKELHKFPHVTFLLLHE